MWFAFALACALFWAVADALSKRALSDVNVLSVVTVRFAYSLPFLWIIPFFTEIPDVPRAYWLTILAMTPLEILAAVLYVKAIQISPLSLTLPYLAFTPVFLILTGYLVVGETVDASGLCGILLVTAGAYVLNLSGGMKSVLDPIRAIARERGSLLMLVVAALYSITGSLGKKAVVLSDPMFFSWTYFTVLTAAMVPAVIAKNGARSLLAGLRPTRWTWGIGVSFAAMMIFHNLAVQLVQVAYMISVKRTSMVFGVILGWLFFGERQVGTRLTGTAIMLAGIGLILLF